MKSRQPFAAPLRCLLYVCPCFRRPFFLISLMAFLIILCSFVPIFRNKILYPVWPNAWREIGTIDVIFIKVFAETHIDTASEVKSCPVKTPPPVDISVIDKTKVKSYSDILQTPLRNPEHQRFIPIVTLQEKLVMLHAYLIIAEIFTKSNIEFFLVEGSMLGAHRHHGMVPWDDDIDISVNVTQWKLVRELLGCIDGFVLEVRNSMHWKFYPNSTNPRYGFPFIDIFFYTENDDYVWAVTHYLAQTVIFAKKDTFPLTTAQFEGLVVPIPKNTDHILRMLFDYEFCQSPSSNHKEAFTYSSKKMSTILCSSLTYLYDMHHLKY